MYDLPDVLSNENMQDFRGDFLKGFKDASQIV